MISNYDFSGWATKANRRCSDGRVIMKDAFKECDGQTVPLVWNHMHNDPTNVLGHALLKNTESGVYAYCTFNDTYNGKEAKKLVDNGDIKALSIYANQLKQKGSNVIHGSIREVSLVLAGCNPEALIDSVMSHGELIEDEAVIYTGEELELSHSDEEDPEDNDNKDLEKQKDDEETVKDIIHTMTDKQKIVMYSLIGEAIKNNEEEEDDEDMKHNVFDNEDQKEVLTHSDIEAIFSDAKRYGSLKDSVMAHGIDNIEYLFPETKNVTNTPIFIQRDMGWVRVVMSSVHKTAFSRIKSLFADITEDDARANGYIKGKFKKEEVFSLLKRTTTPTTIYKKQKLERDDVVDITDFDVVSWLKSEMRMMLDEEIARAVLIGDGRLASSDDKISEQNIRPIFNDAELFTIQASVNVSSAASEDDIAKAFIRSCIKNRKQYKGSGSPTLFTTEDILISCLLLTDDIGRDLYKDAAELAKKLRVKEIITVPVMEGAKGKNGGDLLGIIVNLDDYYIGADKGGAVNMFDDFDIDYNAQKYLIETRCSGALVKPFSAIAVELNKETTQASA